MTATATTTETQTVTLPAPTLARVLANAILATAKDKTRPTLTMVEIKVEGQTFRTTATDSYWLVRETVEVGTSSGDWTAYVDRDALAMVVRAAKDRTASNLDVTITYDPSKTTDCLRFSLRGTSLTMGQSAEMISWPNVDHVIPTTNAETGSVAFGGDLLAKVAKIVPGVERGKAKTGYPANFVFTGSPLKAQRVEWQAKEGESLFAVLMPIRING